MITYVDAKQWYVETADAVHAVVALVLDGGTVRPVVLQAGQLVVLTEYVAVRWVYQTQLWNNALLDTPVTPEDAAVTE